MATYDPSQLAELRHLVVAMARDIDDTRAVGYRLPYTGEDLRVYFRALVRSHGLKTAIVEAQERYELQLAGDLRPLGTLEDARGIGPSNEPGGEP